ncbi:MAG: MotA/TolQ/ExbB proton channel family protein [Pseudomonadales bacterium]|nr:MotA/TolQ/ExbB proton channel family protein [Pseudomonadales bacterium]
MRIAAGLYLGVIVLALLNLVLSFGLPLWIAPLALAGMAGILAAVWLLSTTENRALKALRAGGLTTLVAVAVGFAVPAWEVISTGSSGSWTGRITPLLVMAVALYGAGLWLDAMRATSEDATATIARILSGPNLLMSFVTAGVLCASFLLAMEWLGENLEIFEGLARRFLTRGIIPPITVLLFFWGLLILLGKWFNAVYFGASMDEEGQPSAWRPVQVGRTVRELGANRELLGERLEYLWKRHEESFLMPRYINYVIPVLGFIGTVLGISLAADGITGLFAIEAGLTSLSTELGAAISPLGIAFDTTLIALSLGAVLFLVLTLVQRREERTLTGLERRLREADSPS